jgi:hypothetical protein
MLPPSSTRPCLRCSWIERPITGRPVVTRDTRCLRVARSAVERRGWIRAAPKDLGKRLAHALPNGAFDVLPVACDRGLDWARARWSNARYIPVSHAHHGPAPDDPGVQSCRTPRLTGPDASDCQSEQISSSSRFCGSASGVACRTRRAEPSRKRSSGQSLNESYFGDPYDIDISHAERRRKLELLAPSRQVR